MHRCSAYIVMLTMSALHSLDRPSVRADASSAIIADLGAAYFFLSKMLCLNQIQPAVQSAMAVIRALESASTNEAGHSRDQAAAPPATAAAAALADPQTPAQAALACRVVSADVLAADQAATAELRRQLNDAKADAAAAKAQHADDTWEIESLTAQVRGLSFSLEAVPAIVHRTRYDQVSVPMQGCLWCLKTALRHFVTLRT